MKSTCPLIAAFLVLFAATPGPGAEPQGNALHFTYGSSAVITGPVGLTLPATIEFWAKPEDDAFLVLYADNWYVYCNAWNNSVGLWTSNGSTSASSTSSAGALPTNQWKHVAIVLTAGGDAMFYIDGAVIADNGTVAHSAAAAGSMAIGNDNFGGFNPWVGALDEVRIWSVARTQQEIQDNRGVALTGAETGLVSYHRFNQGTAGGDNTGVTTATATTGTDGTLQNFALTGNTSNWIAATWVVNTSPTVANPIPDQNATEDAAFNFQFAANTFADADVGTTLSYSAQLAGGGSLPAWLGFDAATRTFSGTPANGDVGTVSIDVIADDGAGGTVTDTFAIVVANTNDAPTIANAIPDQNATEDAAFNFQFAANTFADADVGTTLSYSAQLAGGGSLPAWLGFDAVTRTFSGTPANGDVGTVSIDVIADDGAGGTVTDTFAIVVANTNDAPTIANAIPDQNATEDAAFNFQFAANTFADADAGDTLGYTATLASGAALPSWLGFTAATRTFAGTPTNDDVGSITVRVTATDGTSASVSDDFLIAVANANDAPTVAAGIPDQQATQKRAFTFQVATDAFADVDAGDALGYTATQADGSPLPAWLGFDTATRTFTGTPTSRTPVDVRVTASDLAHATASDDFTISIRAQPKDDEDLLERKLGIDPKCGVGGSVAALAAGLALALLGLGLRSDGGTRRRR